MYRLLDQKKRAIMLRKRGYTYSEILKEILVAKSTLSLWLRDVGLTEKQVQKITRKKLQAAYKGGLAKRTQRIEKQNKIFSLAAKDIESLSKRDLWMLGLALYWAEGEKQKEYRPSSGLAFSNSDPRMIRLFLRWLRVTMSVSKENVRFEIYIHAHAVNTVKKVRVFWSRMTDFSIDHFKKVYYKRHTILTNRINKDNLYYGLLRVRVSGSSQHVRKIEGWVRAIDKIDISAL